MGRTICKNCGSTEEYRVIKKGNAKIEIFLWLVLFPVSYTLGTWPAIVGIAIACAYSLYKVTARSYICSRCGGKNIVPIESPEGRELLSRKQEAV